MSKRDKNELFIIWVLVVLTGVFAYIIWHGLVYTPAKPQQADWLVPYDQLTAVGSYENDQNSYNPQVTADSKYLQDTVNPQQAKVKLQ